MMTSRVTGIDSTPSKMKEGAEERGGGGGGLDSGGRRNRVGVEASVGQSSMRAKLLPAVSRWRLLPALDCFLGSREGGRGGGGGRGSLAEVQLASKALSASWQICQMSLPSAL